MTAPRRLIAVFFAVIGLALMAGACSSETQQAIRDGVEESGGLPATTEAPAPTEAPETPAEPEGTDDVEEGLSDEDWLLIAILAVAAFAIVLIATSLSSSRSQKKEATRASFNRNLDQVVGGARWVHDQAIIDILAANDPTRLRSTWNATQGRILDVEQDVAVLAAGVKNDHLQHTLGELGRSLTGLRNLLASNVALRLEPETGREDLVQSSNQAVYDRRPQLSAAIAQVAAARR